MDLTFRQSETIWQMFLQKMAVKKLVSTCVLPLLELLCYLLLMKESKYNVN